jgi:16S rRNA (guanine1207-N2)-methyltransferase
MKFIANAAQALRKDGHLWMVANRQLPYEGLLGDTFAEVDKVVETGAFKVLHASQPTVKPAFEHRRKKRR